MTVRRKVATPGFSLLELMIVVVVVGILSSIAFGAYSRQVARTNRSAAQSFMFKLANKNEQYLLDARGYGNLAQLAVPVPVDVSRNYTVTVTPNNASTPPSYAIAAVPTGKQATSDAGCGTLGLNQTGSKSASGSAGASKCW